MWIWFFVYFECFQLEESEKKISKLEECDCAKSCRLEDGEIMADGSSWARNDTCQICSCHVSFATLKSRFEDFLPFLAIRHTSLQTRTALFFCLVIKLSLLQPIEPTSSKTGSLLTFLYWTFSEWIVKMWDTSMPCQFGLQLWLSWPTKKSLLWL